jgi:putative PIN family toxin of toxin-antitoxin system
MERVVLDTNVFVSALMRQASAPRQVLRLCFQGKAIPLFGNALLNEYEDLLGRHSLFKGSHLNAKERGELLDALLSVSRWISIYYLWRPNLPDEADNHLIELAIAGNARWLITGNKKDFSQAELRLQGLNIVSPSEYLKERKESWRQ